MVIDKPFNLRSSILQSLVERLSKTIMNHASHTILSLVRNQSRIFNQRSSFVQLNFWRSPFTLHVAFGWNKVFWKLH